MYLDGLREAIDKRKKELSEKQRPVTLAEKRAACQEECDRFNKSYFGYEKDLFDCPVCLDKGRVLEPEYEEMYKNYIPVMCRCHCRAGDEYPALGFCRGSHDDEPLDPPERFVTQSIFEVNA